MHELNNLFLERENLLIAYYLANRTAHKGDMPHGFDNRKKPHLRLYLKVGQ